MPTKEQAKKVAQDLASFLKSGKGWDKLVIHGITFQILPEKNSKPKTLAIVHNPEILGKQAKKGYYIHSREHSKAYVESITTIADLMDFLAMCMDAVNPKATAIAKASQSDKTYDFLTDL